MSTFNLTLNLDNAAFDPNPDYEIARILRVISNVIDNEPAKLLAPQIIRDLNGNTVGSFRITKS